MQCDLYNTHTTALNSLVTTNQPLEAALHHGLRLAFYYCQVYLPCSAGTSGL